MKFKFNYLLIIFIVIILGVILTAMVFSGKEIKTAHFSKDEISFNYPDTWQTVNQSRTSQIVAFTDPTEDLNVTVNREPFPIGYNSPENFTLNTNADSGLKLVSHRNIDLNGTTAYENSYQLNSSNRTVQRIEIWISKNDALYSFIITSRDLKLNGTSPEIKAFTDNLVVNNSTVPQSDVWGQIEIPAFGLNWDIRRDTVNHLGSVYQYSNSFYPGQNGTIGLLGHHTKYSAPFANIDQLKQGDQVYINDYLTQKRYIYEVMSNGDIKTDYKTNPIQFPGGVFELTLVTCYPPGSQEAAYLTHCKLISVVPLS